MFFPAIRQHEFLLLIRPEEEEGAALQARHNSSTFVNAARWGEVPIFRERGNPGHGANLLLILDLSGGGKRDTAARTCAEASKTSFPPLRHDFVRPSFLDPENAVSRSKPGQRARARGREKAQL
jgi:hypothetical protein